LKYERVRSNEITTALADGRAESISEIAKKLKKSGVDANIIEKTTGLSADEIMKL